MQAYLTAIAGIGGVKRVQSPYDAGNGQQVSSQGPDAGKVAYANVELPKDIELPEATKISRKIKDTVPHLAGLTVERGGYVLGEYDQPNTEAFGVAFAIVILIVAFGSVLAMGLPIGIALFGIGLVGEYVGRIYQEVQQRPRYVVAKVLEQDSKDAA